MENSGKNSRSLRVMLCIAPDVSLCYCLQGIPQAAGEREANEMAKDMVAPHEKSPRRERVPRRERGPRRERVRRRERTPHLQNAPRRDAFGPLCGVAFVVLLAITFFIGSSPNSNASGAKVIAYYTKHGTAAKVSVVLTDLAVVAGLFFFGYLRDRLRRTDIGLRLAPVAFGGAVLFGAGGCLVSGTTLALSDVPKDLTPAAAQALNVVSNDMPFLMVLVGVSVLTLATGIVILRSRFLPLWVGWLSLVIGVVALLGPLGFFAFLASGIWILILSFMLYRRAAAPMANRVSGDAGVIPAT